MDLPQRIEYLECYSDRLRRQNRWLAAGLLLVGFSVLVSTFRPDTGGYLGAASAKPAGFDVAGESANWQGFPIIAASADGRQFLIDRSGRTPLAIEIAESVPVERPASVQRGFDPSVSSGVQFASGLPVNRSRDRKPRIDRSVD
jgi:hypothetical protein